MNVIDGFWPALLGSSLALGAAAPVFADATHYENRNRYVAPRSTEALIIDGVANESVWQAAEWHDIDHRWLGPEYSAEDFSGRFKVANLHPGRSR
jgi:hypothetical protein